MRPYLITSRRVRQYPVTRAFYSEVTHARVFHLVRDLFIGSWPEGDEVALGMVPILEIIWGLLGISDGLSRKKAA